MPTALYGVYRADFGFSPVTQTLIFAVYAAALVPALFLFGPLSDRVGRRPVLVTALGAGLVGAVVLAAADATAWLVVGRILQGVSVGACSAAGAAALLDHVPGRDTVRAARAASASTAAGAALGPLLAGAVAEYLHSTVLPYVLFAAAWCRVPSHSPSSRKPRSRRTAARRPAHGVASSRCRAFRVTSDRCSSWRRCRPRSLGRWDCSSRWCRRGSRNCSACPTSWWAPPPPRS